MVQPFRQKAKSKLETFPKTQTLFLFSPLVFTQLRWMMFKMSYMRWINCEILVLLLPVVSKSTFTFSAWSMRYSPSGDYFSSSRCFSLPLPQGWWTLDTILVSKCFSIDYRSNSLTAFKSRQALIHIIQFGSEEGWEEFVTANLVQGCLFFSFLSVPSFSYSVNLFVSSSEESESGRDWLVMDRHARMQSSVSHQNSPCTTVIHRFPLTTRNIQNPTSHTVHPSCTIPVLGKLNTRTLDAVATSPLALIHLAPRYGRKLK